MKKKIFALSLCVLLLAGCGKSNATLKDGEQVIVGIKGDKSINVNIDGTVSASVYYFIDVLPDMLTVTCIQEQYTKHTTNHIMPVLGQFVHAEPLSPACTEPTRREVRTSMFSSNFGISDSV